MADSCGEKFCVVASCVLLECLHQVLIGTSWLTEAPSFVACDDNMTTTVGLDGPNDARWALSMMMMFEVNF